MQIFFFEMQIWSLYFLALKAFSGSLILWLKKSRYFTRLSKTSVLTFYSVCGYSNPGLLVNLLIDVVRKCVCMQESSFTEPWDFGNLGVVSERVRMYTNGSYFIRIIKANVHRLINERERPCYSKLVLYPTTSNYSVYLIINTWSLFIFKCHPQPIRLGCISSWKRICLLLRF